MILTEKEQYLLKDMQGQEKLCIQKYDTYAKDAVSGELACLFRNMADTEREHLKTITDIMGGKVTPASETISNGNNQNCGVYAYQNEDDRKKDAFYCQDMLATEKHAATLYNTCVFEFGDPVLRKVLNHIEAEEQQHGEQLYAYMKANGMYS